jgi:hypothetical protein
MTEVIDRLVVAVKAHDLDVAAGLFHEDYRSEQPGAFGQGLCRASPDARQLGGHVRGDPRLPRRNLPVGPGRRNDLDRMALVGHPQRRAEFEVRGVTLFEITDDQIVAGRLYLEDVERDVAGIEQAVGPFRVADRDRRGNRAAQRSPANYRSSG